MTRGRIPRRCRRCKSLLDDEEDIELTNGHCHECYIEIMDEEDNEDIFDELGVA